MTQPSTGAATVVLLTGDSTGAAPVRVLKAMARPTRVVDNFIVILFVELRSLVRFEEVWSMFGEGTEQVLEAGFL